MKREAGYTLLELLVVLAIMGLLLAAVPGIALPGISSMQFSGKMEQVVSGLSMDHEKAIETGTAVTVEPAGLGGAGATVKVISGPAELTFYPDGSSTGGSVAVTAMGRHGVVAIDPITGVAHVF